VTHAYLGTTAGLILGVATLPACRATEPAEKPLTPVLVEAVRGQPTNRPSRYSAIVDANNRVDLAFRVGGYVTALAQVRGRAIQEGDPVTAGTVLAAVRADDYDAKVRQGQAALAEAEAARSAASAALARAEALYASRSLAKPDIEQARAAVASIDAKIDGARAIIREAELARGDTKLIAPSDGVVLRRMIELGSLVGPGTPAFSIVDTSSVRVVIGVPDTMLRRVAVGAVQQVFSEALPDRRFEGRVTKVSPTADQRSRLFDLELTVNNRDGALRPGMVATVDILAPEPAAARTGLTLPLSAVVRAPGGGDDAYAVYVVEDVQGAATTRLRRVTLGELIGNRVSVTSGVAEGDRVVVRGASLVVDGERVNATQ
jgi:RND family efflux transporter MFP subunit